MLCFLRKIYLLSMEVKRWEKEKKKESMEMLEMIDGEIDSLEDQLVEDYFSPSKKRDWLIFMLKWEDIFSNGIPSRD